MKKVDLSMRIKYQEVQTKPNKKLMKQLSRELWVVTGEAD